MQYLAKREEIKSLYQKTSVVWLAFLISLGLYLFICHFFEETVRTSIGMRYPVTTISKTLLGASVAVAILSSYFRRWILSVKFGIQRNRVGDRMPGPTTSVLTAVYLPAVIVPLALSESIGVFGMVLFFLGDNFRSLYLFLAISAISMYYHKPKMNEIEHLSVELEKHFTNA
jgi:hypothetical protein